MASRALKFDDGVADPSIERMAKSYHSNWGDEMDRQTKVFRAHRALAWLYGVICVGVLAVVLLASGGKLDVSMLPMVLAFAGIFAAHYFTARACRSGKPGGRTASIVISCLMLLGFPIGTLIGLYLLANTWRPWEQSV
jgi:multidrug efflux pump subunit AcrB